jgi:hypothetical protein
MQVKLRVSRGACLRIKAFVFGRPNADEASALLFLVGWTLKQSPNLDGSQNLGATARPGVKWATRTAGCRPFF